MRELLQRWVTAVKLDRGQCICGRILRDDATSRFCSTACDEYDAALW